MGLIIGSIITAVVGLFMGALAIVGHRLVESVRSVLFAPAYPLVQDLLAAKRDLAVRIASPKTLPNDGGCLT